MPNQANPLNPTWEGFVDTTHDATLLFEACLVGDLNHVPRRPHDRERADIIKSGHIFIYEEHASGIKRWTDGVSWSPSRILGNFLIYRELEKPFPPGEKKRANKKAAPKKAGIMKPTVQPAANTNLNTALDHGNVGNKDAERALIGSLIDSYPFKPDGLIKKTISITYHGVPHHLVSYYNVQEVLQGGMMIPSKDHALTQLNPRWELTNGQNWRAPPHEVDVYTPNGNMSAMYPPSHVQTLSAYSNELFRSPMSHSHNPHMQSLQYENHANPTYQYSQQHVTQQVPQAAYNGIANTMEMAAPAALAHLPYTMHSPGEYALEHSRARMSSGNSISQEFPRQMPGSPGRRHSAYDTNPIHSSPIANMPMGSEGGDRAMHPVAAYYLHNRGGSDTMPDPAASFGQSPHIKTEPINGKLAGSHMQSYGRDGGGGQWDFDGMTESHTQPFYHATNGVNPQQYAGAQQQQEQQQQQQQQQQHHHHNQQHQESWDSMNGGMRQQ